MSLDLDSPASPAVPPDAPAKVARRGGKAPKPSKAPKVVKTRAPRTTPARTLRVRVAELGANYPGAFDTLAALDCEFAGRIRTGFAAKDMKAQADRHLDKCMRDLESAKASLAIINEVVGHADTHFDRLEREALHRAELARKSFVRDVKATETNAGQ